MRLWFVACAILLNLGCSSPKQAEHKAISGSPLNYALPYEQAEDPCHTVKTCAQYVSNRVSRYWYIPNTSGKKMKAMAEIRLDDHAIIESATIVESSGNQAFDDSGLSALNNLGSFPELMGLSRSDYQKNFTHFNIWFAP